jgi:predicted NAD-dependent protein-ADP-ribosyltransferase YbiA (DUF1768 family)
MTEIKIESDAMQAIVSKAILEGIDENQRKAIMEQAVAALIAPRGGDTYGRNKTTPLQDAFDAAVRNVVHEVARDAITDNAELREKVRALVVEAMAGALDKGSKLRERVADAVANSIVESWER